MPAETCVSSMSFRRPSTRSSCNRPAQSSSVRLSGDFFLNHRPAKSAPHFTWAWPAKGHIDGRLDVQGGQLPPGLKITVQTESQLSNGHRVGTYGEQEVEVAADGRFKIEDIAAGPITILPFLDDDQPLRAEVPPDVRVEQGKTTSLVIPVRRGVLVRGQVRKQDTKQGYPDFQLVLLYGQSARDHRDMLHKYDIETDAEGRFTAVVPPGPIELRPLSAPRDYLDVESWTHTGGYWGSRRIVPAAEENDTSRARACDLEPIDLAPAATISGRLVDLDMKPLGNDWCVFGYPHIPGRQPREEMNSFSGASPDRDGRFSGNYPQDLSARLLVGHAPPLADAAPVRRRPLG